MEYTFEQYLRDILLEKTLLTHDEEGSEEDTVLVLNNDIEAFKKEIMDANVISNKQEVLNYLTWRKKECQKWVENLGGVPHNDVLDVKYLNDHEDEFYEEYLQSMLK